MYILHVYTSNNKYDREKLKTCVHLYCLCIHIKIHSYLIIIIAAILNGGELL